jgi:hypothetical protein
MISNAMASIGELPTGRWSSWDTAFTCIQHMVWPYVWPRGLTLCTCGFEFRSGEGNYAYVFLFVLRKGWWTEPRWRFLPNVKQIQSNSMEHNSPWETDQSLTWKRNLGNPCSLVHILSQNHFHRSSSLRTFFSSSLFPLDVRIGVYMHFLDPMLSWILNPTEKMAH